MARSTDGAKGDWLFFGDTMVAKSSGMESKRHKVTVLQWSAHPESKSCDGVKVLCLIIPRDLRKNRFVRGAFSIIDIFTFPYILIYRPLCPLRRMPRRGGFNKVFASGHPFLKCRLRFVLINACKFSCQFCFARESFTRCAAVGLPPAQLTLRK